MSYYTNLRSEMMPFVPAIAGRILEIGCGEGNFGAALKSRQKTEVWGIEMNPAASTVAAQKFEKVLVGDVSAKLAEIPDDFFDAIIANDVLEHLPNFEAVLVQLKSKLAPGSVLVCSLPNLRYLPVLYDLVVHGRFEYADSGVLDRTHMRFFTKSSMISAFAKAGYKIATIEGINPISSWKFSLFNFFTLGFFSDTRYIQYAVVANV